MMIYLTILLFIPATIFCSDPFRWGHHKPHLIYSYSEKDLSPITFRLAFGYSDHSTPVRYDFRDGENTDIVVNYNYNNGRNFSEQTVYDKSKNFQFKMVTSRVEESRQWTLSILPPQGKGFVSEMLADIYRRFTSQQLFNSDGFMDRGSFTTRKPSTSSQIILGFSITLEQFLSIDPSLTRDFYLMKDEEQPNSFIIRHKTDHEIISLFKFRLFEEEILKEGVEFEYKLLPHADKTQNWRIGDELKAFVRDWNTPVGQESQQPSSENTALLIRVPVKMSSNFLIQLVYSEDLTFTDESNYSGFIHQLQSKRLDFLEKFLTKLPLSHDSDDYLQCSASALSNLLGGLLYSYGGIKSSSSPHSYQQAQALFTASPCRKGFARGFLWDEGFHNMLIAQFDPHLSLEIIKHWTETVFNSTGWIPREQIRGPEVESYAHPDYLVQNELEANPPTLLLPLHYLFQKFKAEGDLSGLTEVKRLFPKLLKWFEWFHNSQRRDPVREEFLYHWAVERGEYNFGSGMDDYPRGRMKYHLDLQVWNIVASERLLDMISEGGSLDSVGISIEEVERLRLVKEKSKENLHKVFRDPDSLLYKGSDGVGFSPHLGYDNLFPLMFGLVDSEGGELDSVLRLIRDDSLLWSSAGIRSLSKEDSYYRGNDNYWTSPVWVNMNYLVLRGLKLYYVEKSEKAREVYRELRENLMRNVCGEWKNTGYFWETFDDRTGQGTHHFLFNGWTSLISLVISEKYI